MNTTNPTRVVRFNLLGTLIAVAIPFAIEGLIVSYSHDKLIATCAFLITSINFFHGKVATLEDDDYNVALVHRPALALADFALNMTVILSLAILAFFLGSPRHLLIVNILVRFFDAVLVGVALSIGSEQAIRRAQHLWLRINIGAAAVFSLLLFGLSPVDEHKLLVASAFLVVTLIDIALDYGLNKKLYFSIANSWGDLAEFWDAAEGEFGDVYRQGVVLPELRATLGPFAGKRILELGCGTGCVARVLANEGATVVGVDKYESMLRIARRYATEHVEYKQYDMEVETGLISGGNYDAVVAIFCLQDLSSTERALKTMRYNLRAGGIAVVCYEAESDGNGCHATTSRTWLDPPTRIGAVRRQLIFWAPEFIIMAHGEEGMNYQRCMAAKWPKGFATVTRQWSDWQFLRSAWLAGFRPFLPTRVCRVTGERAKGEVLKRYQSNPRFRMAVLTHQFDSSTGYSKANDPRRTPRLVLLSGVSRSGKSTVATAFAGASVLHMDDFYFSCDDHRVPRKQGRPDWESRDSVDLAGLHIAVERLLDGEAVEVPCYDMQQSRRRGTKIVHAATSGIIVVEGLFAFDVFPTGPCQVKRVLLRADPLVLLWRRVLSDIREKRRTPFHAITHALHLASTDKSYCANERQYANVELSTSVPPSRIAGRIIAMFEDTKDRATCEQ